RGGHQGTADRTAAAPAAAADPPTAAAARGKGPPGAGWVYGDGTFALASPGPRQQRAEAWYCRPPRSPATHAATANRPAPSPAAPANCKPPAHRGAVGCGTGAGRAFRPGLPTASPGCHPPGSPALSRTTRER